MKHHDQSFSHKAYMSGYMESVKAPLGSWSSLSFVENAINSKLRLLETYVSKIAKTAFPRHLACDSANKPSF